MEDILASIRRILNDDETVADPAHEVPPGGEPPGHQAPAAQDDVYVLDQSMLVDQPPATPPLPLPLPVPAAAIAAPPPAAMLPEPFPQQAIPAPMTPSSLAPADPADPLISPSTAAAASASMGALVRVVGQQQTAVYRGGPTLEDMVRDEIRPMVKSWLDEHLPPMVERMVRAEIARVTEGK